MTALSDHPDRVLIVRPSALGDVCRTVPVLASIRRAWPGAAIDWVVQDTFVPAVAAHPDLREAIPFPRHRYASSWRRPGRMRELLGWLGGLRKEKYDIVFDCQGLGRSGMITRWTGAPRRVGLKTAREFGWVGYTQRVEITDDAHTVEEMLGLVNAVGIDPVRDMRLYVAQSDQEWRAAFFREREMQTNEYIVLAPTSRWASKRWPVDHWIELIDRLSHDDKPLLLLGGPNEHDQIEPIFEHIQNGTNGANVVDLVGETTIGQSMALIENAAAVVANDSAPLHMAVGFDTPYVALFGPTDPDRVGPFGGRGVVLRRTQPTEKPAHFKDKQLGDTLMRRIPVDDVHNALGELMESNSITSDPERATA